jgi:signal transduction histidine kinase
MTVGAERITEIVLSLRNFSRLDETEMKAVNIHEGIDNTLLILEHRLKAKSNSLTIDIIKQYGDLPLVECYAGQLNQVFMNLLANAIDALEEAVGNGEWGVKKAALSTPQIKIHTQLNSENQVVIGIADNGLGIPENVQKHLFEPFFTTKPVGKGTGLGLSISYQIVTQKHLGQLQCISTPGQGTEFVIVIPLNQQAI